jgi:NodT family efflux transporter outer membrane factor (OMF) lipoprotein
MSFRHTTLLAPALAICTSCAVGPDYVAPKPTTMPAYAGAAPSTRPSGVSVDAEPTAQWWTTLHDPELDKLVTRAVAGNFDLQKATARLAESRSTLRLEGAKELPTLSNSDQFVRINSGQNVGLGSLGGGGSGGGSSSINSNVWTAGFDASWEIDVFGGQRRRIEAAKADYQAGVEDRRDVLVSLTAEVARDYLELRGLQERLRIARDNLALEQDTLGLTRSLRKAGFNSELDVSRASTQVAQTRAAIVPLTTMVSQQEHAIATLLGQTPNDLTAELDHVTKVPEVPALVSVGMPADLIRRRPDIRRAERDIASANARIGAAIADFYPKFSFTGDFGLDATKFNPLFNQSSRFFIIDPAISWRLFDFGRTAAQVDQEKAKHVQMILAYQQAVLTALREVEDALVAYANEQDHHAALADAVTSAQESVAISRDQYKEGVIDFLQVLDAQRQLLSAQDELAQSDQAITTNLVALYKALGGGWEDEADHTRHATPNADVPPAIGLSSLGNSAGGDPQQR